MFHYGFAQALQGSSTNGGIGQSSVSAMARSNSASRSWIKPSAPTTCTQAWNGGRSDLARLRHEVAADDFLKDKFKDFDLPVALDKPLQRLTELLELVGPQVTQRGQGERFQCRHIAAAGHDHIGLRVPG